MLSVNTIHNQDCLETMAQWPDNAVDVIVTSPPWNVKFDYGDYSDDNKPDFDRWLTKVCIEMERVDKNAVYVFMNQDHMWSVQKGLLHFKQWLFYHKRNMGAMHYHNIYWSKTITPIAMSVPIKTLKMNKYKNISQIDLISGVNPQSDYIHNKRVHPAQDPIEAYLPLVARTPGEVFYDPFMGSGTLALTALKLGKKYIGSEINPEFVDIANARIKQAKSQVDIFTEQLTIG